MLQTEAHTPLPQDTSAFLSDGLHLSPKGNDFVFSHLWPLVERKVSALPLLLPDWKDVAAGDPEWSLLGEGGPAPAEMD